MVSVVIHVFGLLFIYERVVPILTVVMERHRFLFKFLVIVGVIALLATVLHAIEAAAWAVAYRFWVLNPTIGQRCFTLSAQLQATATRTSFWNVNGNSWAPWRR
jgi:hypothetical protein